MAMKNLILAYFKNIETASQGKLDCHRSHRGQEEINVPQELLFLARRGESKTTSSGEKEEKLAHKDGRKERFGANCLSQIVCLLLEPALWSVRFGGLARVGNGTVFIWFRRYFSFSKPNERFFKASFQLNSTRRVLLVGLAVLSWRHGIDSKYTVLNERFAFDTAHIFACFDSQSLSSKCIGS